MGAHAGRGVSRPWWCLCRICAAYARDLVMQLPQSAARGQGASTASWSGLRVLSLAAAADRRGAGSRRSRTGGQPRPARGAAAAGGGTAWSQGGRRGQPRHARQRQSAREAARRCACVLPPAGSRDGGGEVQLSSISCATVARASLVSESDACGDGLVGEDDAP